MKMSKKLTKAIVLAACAVLLIVGSIAGTVAYLTSTATIQNTFTFGNVAITLDEAKYDKTSDTFDNNSRVTSNEYKLVPGKEYKNDAKITVTSGSEACYLYVKIDSAFAAVCQDLNTELTRNGWTKLGETDVFYYTGNIADTDNEVLVIGKFTVLTTIGNNAASITNNPTIVAYAVQMDGFDTPVEAWTAASASFAN